MRRLTVTALAIGTAMLVVSPAYADEGSPEAEIAELKAQVATQAALLQKQAAQLAAIEQRLQGVPTPTVPAAASAAPASVTPPQPAADSAPALAVNDDAGAGSATTIGGYGEITYNNYLKDSSRNQADLKRFVLFFGHRFNDKLDFNSELEVEHAIASSDDEGEVDIEQAYLNYAFKPALNLKAGLFLMPFGFLNRNHEPPVFYGVERNEVETRIIPSTWREGGIGLWGNTDFGLSYDFGVTTGFDVARFDKPGKPLAGSHQELQLAKAADLSIYGSLEYRPTPGLLIGAAAFTGDAIHNNADFKADNTLPDFAGIDTRATLWDVHARWQAHGFDLQALYARGTLSHAAEFDRVLLAYNAANGSDLPLAPSAFYGWLVQGAYSFSLGGDVTLDPFIRYEKFDTQAKLPLGLAPDPANRDRVLTTGFSFHPIDPVVLKVDYQKYFENKANDRINFGLGYMF
jgi:uncharacterized coiled-coil protein SlyX